MRGLILSIMNFLSITAVFTMLVICMVQGIDGDTTGAAITLACAVVFSALSVVKYHMYSNDL